MAVTTHNAITGSGGVFTDSIPGEGKFTAVATTILTTPGGTQLTVTSNPVTIAANYDVSIAFVDDGNGTITGALLGDPGTVVSGVTVTLTITDASGNTTIAVVTTDSSGNFSYTLTTPGNYTITATATVTTPLGESKNIASDELDVALILLDEGSITLTAVVSELGSVSVSGAISASEWLSVAGLTVELSFTDESGNTVTETATTDSTGAYSYTFSGNGVYTIVAECDVSSLLTVTSEIVTVTLNSPEHAGDLLYSIDFTTLASLDGLSISRYYSTAVADFSVVSGRVVNYSLSNEGLTLTKANTSTTACVFYFDDIIVDDFVATFQIKLNTALLSDTTPTNYNIHAGLHFRSAQKNLLGWRTAVSKYRTVLTQGDSPTSVVNSIVNLDSELAYGDIINCRVEASGTTVKFFVNDTLADQYTRATSNISGYLGLLFALYRSTSYQNAAYRNLNVYKYVN